MDTPPPVQLPPGPTPEFEEATSADLEKIFGKIPAPSVTFDDDGSVVSGLPIPEPPPAPVAETPAVNPDVVAATENTPAGKASTPSKILSKAEDVSAVASPPLPTRQQIALKARTELGVNWSAAFLLFAKGVSLKQISVEFDIPFARLTERYFKEDWETLVKKHGGALVSAPPKPENVQLALIETEKRMKRVIENRDRNYESAEALREDIMKVIAAYRADNQFLRPDDIATLAKALKMTFEISQMALGDDFVLGKAGESGKGGGGNNMRPIIINLPSAVSMGKDQRRAEVVGESEDQPAPGKEVDADAVIELAVVGKTQGDREAKPAASGKGCGVNFEALPKIKPASTP